MERAAQSTRHLDHYRRRVGSQAILQSTIGYGDNGGYSNICSADVPACWGGGIPVDLTINNCCLQNNNRDSTGRPRQRGSIKQLHLGISKGPNTTKKTS